MKIGDIYKFNRSLTLVPVQKQTRRPENSGMLAWRWNHDRPDRVFQHGELCMIIDTYELPREYQNTIILVGDQGYFACSEAYLELVASTSSSVIKEEETK